MENAVTTVEQQNADGVEQVTDVQEVQTPTKIAQPMAMDEGKQSQPLDNAKRKSYSDRTHIRQEDHAHITCKLAA